MALLLTSWWYYRHKYFKDGRVVYTVDEPTGGTHMNLVISGAYGISIPEAEAYKRNEANKRDVYATIRPVVEKWQLFLSVRYMRAAMKKERL